MAMKGNLKNSRPIKPATPSNRKIDEYLSLKEGLNSNDLIEFIESAKGGDDFFELCEMIVNHPKANKKLFWEIFLNANGDRGLLNALSVLRKCPRDIIENLLKSSIKSVSEHAELNLLTRSIWKIKKGELVNLLRKHGGDTHLDTNIRAIIAASKRTPVNILRVLENDDIDFISQIAKDNLRSRSRSKLQEGK